MEKINCPQCQHEMMLTSKYIAISLNNKTAEVLAEGHWCDNCGEAIFEGKTLIEIEKALEQLKG